MWDDEEELLTKAINKLAVLRQEFLADGNEVSAKEISEVMTLINECMDLIH